jgi:hypothetical protein
LREKAASELLDDSEVGFATFSEGVTNERIHVGIPLSSIPLIGSARRYGANVNIVEVKQQRLPQPRRRTSRAISLLDLDNHD